MKKKKKGYLFFSMAASMVIPIVILGIILVCVGQESVAEGMEIEIRESLTGSVRAGSNFFQMLYKGEFELEDGKFSIGENDLTNNTALVDHLKVNSGLEYSVYVDDEIVTTTIKDEDGKRIIGKKNSDKTISEYVNNENDYYSPNVKIGGVSYFGYYTPMYNTDGSIGAMLFAGKKCEVVTAQMNTITTKIIMVFIIAILVVIAMVSVYAKNIVTQLHHILVYIGKLADNNYTATMSDTVLKRRDELGEMAQYAVSIAEKIKELIAYDPLTALFNRRAGRSELSKLKEQVDTDPKKSLSVVMGDIDFFKSINDNYGHDCGDIVLRRIADVLKEHMNGLGFCVRWGGEEFLLIFKRSTKEALEETNKILESIREEVFVYQEQEFRVTMTFGITENVVGNSMDELIKQADKLLYEGKESGRNRIIIQ